MKTQDKLNLALKRAVMFRWWLEDMIYFKKAEKTINNLCKIENNHYCFCFEGAMTVYWRFVTGRGYWRTRVYSSGWKEFILDGAVSEAFLPAEIKEFFFVNIIRRDIVEPLKTWDQEQICLFVVNDNTDFSLLEIADLYVEEIKLQIQEVS